MQTHFHYIHGHACLHDLMCIGADYRHVTMGHPYNQILDDKKRHSQVVFAVHPLSKDYELVCEDFGFKLKRIVHHWNSLSVRELFDVFATFNWSDHVADVGLDTILNPKHQYTELWYKKVFQSHISKVEYWDTILGPGSRQYTTTSSHLRLI